MGACTSRIWASAAWVAVSVCPLGAFAFSTGITGVSGKQGAICNQPGCHAGGVAPSVRFEGPTQLEPQAIATFRFVIRSNAPQQQIAAGLNVAASDGMLITVPNEGTRLQLGEITHMMPKRLDPGGEAAFTFQWQAPAAPGEYTLFGAGNNVNLNGTNRGDLAAATTWMVRVAAGEPPTPTPTASLPLPDTPTTTATPTATATPTTVPTDTPGVEVCLGDCGGDFEVTVDEVITGVNIALGLAPLGNCPVFDADGDQQVTVDELIRAVINALNGCPLGREEFVASEADFECLVHWPRVRHFRITNRLGRLAEALAVAESIEQNPGFDFPVGTIVQLIPGEAMVKRGGGFEPEHGGWEYLTLTVNRTGTRITSRGGAETACYGCHSAARSFDYVCESNHGCVPLMLSTELVDLLQNSDPRCQRATEADS